jgi:hypothetical protein
VSSSEFTVLLVKDRLAALRIYFKAWLDASASEAGTIEALVCRPLARMFLSSSWARPEASASTLTSW